MPSGTRHAPPKCNATGVADGAGRAAEALAFVELDDVPTADGGGCIIELEKGNGTSWNPTSGWARLSST